MHYTIYKITNQINGKYYIGRHATKDVNDSYMGSGIGIRNAIHWKKSMGKYISRGKHKGFLVEQLSTYKESV